LKPGRQIADRSPIRPARRGGPESFRRHNNGLTSFACILTTSVDESPPCRVSEIALAPKFQVLDERLPLLELRQTVLHENVTVLEANDVAQLAELAVNPKIRRYLLARLSDTVALVDPGHAEVLAKALLAEGHTPKMVKGIQP